MAENSMGSKDRKKRIKNRIIWCVVIMSVFAGIVLSFGHQQRIEPINGTENRADSSLILQADGEPSTEKMASAVKNENNKTSAEDEDEKNKDEEKKGNEKSKKEKDEGREKQDKKGKNEGNKTNDGKTDVIYFTTTIKNGETVTKKDYSFSIKHKIADLSPMATKIYINGKLGEDIKDARTDFTVFLNEGENEIIVQVEYKNSQGQKLTPYKKYTINVDTRRLVINTSLKDGMETDSSFLSFTASAAFGENDVDIKVKHGDERLHKNDGVYETELSKGKNTISISASYESHNLVEDYEIIYNPPKGMHIETDLTNQTVKAITGDFSFKAHVVGGNSKTKFTVTLNNKKVEGNQGNYDVVLEPQGERAYNTIRLRATDGNEEDSLTFKVKYIPLATAETEPKITHVNIKDGQTISKANPFTLEIAASDYKNNQIYYDNIDVYLNGGHQILRDTKPYITYKLNFIEGSNTVKISISDKDGRIKEYNYEIIYKKPKDNEKSGTVTVIMDASVIGKGTLVSASNVDIFTNDNMASVIVRTLQAKGYSCSYSGSVASGFYLKSVGRSGIGNNYRIDDGLINEINEFGISWRGSQESPQRNTNSLGEHDYTNGSGWMFLKNGGFIGESASGIDLDDGDIIKIRYTLAYGMDIGGTYQGTTFSKTY